VSSRRFLRISSRYLLLLLLILSAGCLPGKTQDSGAGIRRVAGPYALNTLTWELHNTFAPPDSSASGLPVSPAVLAADIEQALAQQNIAAFPPVRPRLEEPPLLLVVSPRDHIQYIDRLLLLPGLNVSQVEEIENGISSLGLSSLVVRIGGLGAAYPAIVSPSLPLKTIVEATVEEWAHQYLALRPLGFLYLLDSLGLSQDPVVITMNETLAGMISDEIGAAVYQKYNNNLDVPRAEGPDDGFDFAAEMRLTRQNVDELLAAAKVDEAEAYMEARRLFFNSNGYRIRKLNQAYFAFHGIYGRDPGSASPVYGQMKKLRAASASLAEFIGRVSAMNGYSDLAQSVEKLPR